MNQPDNTDDSTQVRLPGASTGEWSNSPAPPLPAGVPARLGRFEIRKVLGEGAFGRVYLAFDPELERPVAIKVPHRDGLSPAFRERFLREARATATIHHPNVCPVHDVGTDGDLPYIVMHFVVGGTLAGVLERLTEPLPPRHAVLLTRKLALGIAAAHAKGVIHRDLKPQNVLYDHAAREVLITDFGLARISGNALQTADGAVFGTPAYMSPEQARGKQENVGPLSDVYSLGVILYQMLAGRLPFTGSAFELLFHHWETVPQPPSATRLGLDPRLDAIALKAMAKQPSDRYSSAQDFVNALTDYLRTLPATESDEQFLESLAAPSSGALAAAGLQATLGPESTAVDEERIRCPKCRAPIRVARNRTEPVECSLCQTRFTVAEGRGAANPTSSTAGKVSSGGTAWSSSVLDPNQRRAPGAPIPREEWLPVARGLWQSAYGVALAFTCLFAFIGIGLASGGHSLDQTRYLIASLVVAAGQIAGLVLMGLGRRRAANLPPGIPGRVSALTSAFAAWLVIPCVVASYGLGFWVIAPLPITLALTVFLVGEYCFVRYLAAIAPHIGHHFPLTRAQIARMYLRVAVCCAFVAVLVTGITLALTQKHGINVFLAPPAVIGFVCVPVGVVLSAWLNVSAARLLNRHATGS